MNLNNGINEVGRIQQYCMKGIMNSLRFEEVLSDKYRNPLGRLKVGLLILLFLSIALPQKVSSAILIINAGLFVFSTDIFRVKAYTGNSLAFQAIAAHLLVLVLSAVISFDLVEGIKQLEKRLPMLLAPLIFFSPLLRSSVLRLLLLRVFILSWSALALYSIVSTFGIYDSSLEDESLYFYVLPQTLGLSSNYYALYISFAFLSLLIGLSEALMRRSVFNYVLLVFLFSFLMMLSSRAAVLSVLIISTGYLFLRGYRNRKARLYLVFGSITIFAGVIIAASQVPYLRNRFVNVGADDRVKLYESSIKCIDDNPWIGTGLGDVTADLHKQFLIDKNDYLLSYHHPHSEYLHQLIASGITGLIVFVGMIGVLLYLAVSSRSALSIAFVVHYALLSVTEVMTTRHLGVMFFSLFVSLLFIKSDEEKDTSRKPLA